VRCCFRLRINRRVSPDTDDPGLESRTVTWIGSEDDLSAAERQRLVGSRAIPPYSEEKRLSRLSHVRGRSVTMGAQLVQADDRNEMHVSKPEYTLTDKDTRKA
jgi:hypothetical protein